MDKAAGDSLIEVRDVTLRRNGRTILDHVDITVASGEIVTLIGQNGAGKSTLVKVVLGIERADSGTVVRRPDLRIGYQPQSLAMDAGLPLSVRRFLTLTIVRPEARLRQALAQVQMEHMLDASIHRLSGGELQRVLIARAVLRDPDLLVLDEPTQNIDMAGAIDIYRLIAEFRDRRGCGVLLVSHDLNVVMARTNRVYCLNGHICCSGAPADVERHPEYRRLFGQAGDVLSIYAHTHDHAHGPHGHEGPEHHDHGQHDHG
jgi:zinc transport system ATP-binding protein